MFSAIVVAIFLAIPYWKKRYFGKFAKKPKQPPEGGGALPAEGALTAEQPTAEADPPETAQAEGGADHV